MVITKGRNPKYQGSRNLRLQGTELEQSWEEAATSQTPLSLNHVTSNRLGAHSQLWGLCIYFAQFWSALSEQTVCLCSATSQCVSASDLHNFYTTCKQHAFCYKLSVREVSNTCPAGRMQPASSFYTTSSLILAAAGSHSKIFWIAEIFISSRAWRLKKRLLPLNGDV